MRWTDLPIVAFDTETTGLNAWDGHRVIEFAAVRFRVDPSGNAIPSTWERHQFLFNPGIPIPREVQDLTGITNDDIATRPPFEKLAAQVRSLLEGAVTVAHNYPFDQGFLASEFKRCHLDWPLPVAEIDTLDLSHRYFQGVHGHKLEQLANRLGVSLEGAHRAVNDAEACARSFLALTRRNDAPTDLDGLIEWADAVGKPPATTFLVRNAEGRIVFGDGPKAQCPIEEHPDHLAWMTFALHRVNDGWQPRYPESVRRWAARWLRIRGAGRAPQGSKSFSAQDWGLDSCALPDEGITHVSA